MGSVLDYLSSLFDRGLAYNTINVHKSAISHSHAGWDGTKVGTHRLVQKLMLGAYNQRPPTPKYPYIWDVDTVLAYIRSQGDNQSLSDGALTLKTAMLLALTTAARASELQALNLEFFSDGGDHVEFVVPTLTKVQRRGKKALKFTIRAFQPDPLLDVVATVRAYITRTAAWRSSKDRHALFLTTTGRHTPVATSTISGWLVKLMTDAGIDTDKFKGHSTRSAAVTKAASAGCSVAEILSRANWSNATTFRKFYHRDTEAAAPDFESRVLLTR